jgi:hypothetical protein
VGIAGPAGRPAIDPPDAAMAPSWSAPGMKVVQNESPLAIVASR